MMKVTTSGDIHRLLQCIIISSCIKWFSCQGANSTGSGFFDDTTVTADGTTFTIISTDTPTTEPEFSGIGNDTTVPTYIPTTSNYTSDNDTTTVPTYIPTTSNYTSDNDTTTVPTYIPTTSNYTSVSENESTLGTTIIPKAATFATVSENGTTLGTTSVSATSYSTSASQTVTTLDAIIILNTTFPNSDESTTAMEFSGMESTTALLTTEGSKNETTFGTTDVTTTFYSTAESGITNGTMVNPTTLLTTTENEATVETTTIFEAIETTTGFVAPPCEETCDNECKAHRTCSCRSDICTEVCPVCGENSTCVNLQCQCLSGYNFTNAEEVNCTDINECDNDVCPGPGRNCTNSPGSFQCVCEEGYVPNPTAPGCLENKCSSSKCGSNSGCLDSSTECQCFVGYSGNPENECFDVDECTSLPQACLVTEICINTNGSYYCDCISGYTKSEDDVCMPIKCGIDAVQCNATSSLFELCQSASNVPTFTEITFPSTFAGYSALSDNLCGDGTPNAGIPLGSRACALDGTWEKAIWLSSCGDGLSTVASQPIENEEDRQQVSASLEILTSNPQEVDSEDVTSTTEAIANVTTSAANISAATATSVISTISNVMESPGLDASGQSQQLLAQLDLVASKVSLENGEPYQAVSNNVSMLVTESQNTVEGTGMVMFVRPNTSSNGFRSDQFSIYNSPITSGGRIAGQQVQSSIHIPAKALENSTKASFYVFGNANLFTANSNSRSSGTANNASDVSSMVISATVENRSISDLPPESLLTYSLPILYDGTKDEPTCVFWSEVSGKWSEEGCNVNKSASDNETLSCSCDHLTNFAALLRPIPGNQKALNVITIVGCTISTFSLIILVLIFLFVPKTRAGRKFQAAFLLVNLSLALLGLNITLLISEMPFISTPENYDSIASSCIAIAIILHFFLLASCAWMNCEGAMLCLAVIKPLYTRAHLQNNKVVMGSVSWGWVMPAIFVGIVALSDINVYKYPYDEEFVVTCWIQPSYIIYLAVIPTAIMIGANLVVYVILSYYLCRNRQGGWGKSWKSTRESQKRKLGVNLSILILLGMTWIFGFFLAGIENETAALVFAYIFTILNSLQGFFLLVLYVLRNKETRTTVRKEISSMYDKLALSSSRSKESGRGRRFSTGFTDIQSNPYPQTFDNTVDIDVSETAGEISLNSTIRRRSQNDYASEVVINWRTMSDENAL